MYLLTQRGFALYAKSTLKCLTHEWCCPSALMTTALFIDKFIHTSHCFKETTCTAQSFAIVFVNRKQPVLSPVFIKTCHFGTVMYIDYTI